jgi:hypothetical protein
MTRVRRVSSWNCRVLSVRWESTLSIPWPSLSIVELLRPCLTGCEPRTPSLRITRQPLASGGKKRSAPQDPIKFSATVRWFRLGVVTGPEHAAA